jgi:hypothetical protein
MTPADAEYLKDVREKIVGYPRLAREALQRREVDKAEEYWRLWHEAIEELLKQFGAPAGKVDCSSGDP